MFIAKMEIEIRFGEKNFFLDEDRVEVDTIKTLFSLPTTNFALVDKNRVLIRKVQNYFVLAADRAPYALVASDSTSNRTIVPQPPLAIPMNIRNIGSGFRGQTNQKGRNFYHPYTGYAKGPVLGTYNLQQQNGPVSGNTRNLKVGLAATAEGDADEEPVNQSKVFSFLATKRKANGLPEKGETRNLRVNITRKDSKLSGILKALRTKYPEYPNYVICDKSGAEVESDEITESINFWTKRLAQMYYLPSRLGGFQISEDIQSRLEKEFSCVICCNVNNTQFIICGHCGKNSCCVVCAQKIFEGRESGPALCPLCKKIWERFGAEWLNHSINRPFKDLAEIVQEILADYNGHAVAAKGNGHAVAKENTNKKCAPKQSGGVLGDISNAAGPSGYGVQRTPSPGRKRGPSVVSTPNVHTEITLEEDADVYDEFGFDTVFQDHF